MRSKTRRNIAYDRKEDALPDLNAGTVQSLAQKIQDSFKQPSKELVRPSNTKLKNDKASRSAKTHGTATNSGRESRSGERDEQNVQEQKTKYVASKGHEQTQGHKRLRNGQVKNVKSNAATKASGVKPRALDSRPKLPSTAFGEELEGEVLALGGTTDDVNLIRDVGSDSEIEADSSLGRAPLDKGLKKELLQMVKGLDIEKGRNHTLEDSGFINNDMEYAILPEPDRMKVQKNGVKPSSNVVRPSNKPAQDNNRAHIRFDGGTPQSSTQIQKTTAAGKDGLLFQPQAEWHSTDMPPLPESGVESKTVPLDLLDRLHLYAKTLLERENAHYASNYGSASTERKFYSTLMSAGTLSDKISALTLSVQESPLHNMKALESLLGLARKRSRDQAVNVLGALKDLFGPGNLLPSDRKLRNFANQPGLIAAFQAVASHSWTSSSRLPESLQENHLIFFAYEDWLKSIFFEILQILETWCNDEVTYARGKAVEYIASLLRDKPEQEANLLRLMVNKLGDSDRKVASKASFNILQLETSHPLIKPTIVAAIESDVLFRPKQSLHAQYYAIITLNQTVLSSKEEDLSRKLLDIYFDLFAKLLRRPEIDQQQDVAPVVGATKFTLNKKGEIQGGGGAPGKKALKKQKSADKSTNVEEDLREKMLSAILTGINRAVPYTITNDDFFEKHMDTLYRITHSANFNTSVQALMLIQQINGINQGSQDRFYRVLYESLLDQRLLTSSKQALYLNLLFRALRSDLNLNRVKAFVKRLLQTIAMHQPPLVCGVLYLIRELEKTFPALAMLVDKPEEDASDEEEVFHDMDDEDANARKAVKPVASFIPKGPRYDPRKRDPIHASASLASLWELPILIKHYHPSVSLFARSLLSHDLMPQKPDLQQNTLISFLDRFVYKNPKASASSKAKGPSIMQPLSSGDDGNILLPAASRLVDQGQPVNSDVFWRQDDKDVGANEVFFHKYFRTIKNKEEKKREKKAKKSREEKDGDDDSSDEEEEAAIWKALVDSRPEIEGDDSDVDMDFSDDEEFAAAMAENDGSEASFPDEDLLNNEEDMDSQLGDDDAFSDFDDIDEKDDSSKITQDTTKRASTGQPEDKKAKKRKMKGLPTFASVDDYAKLLGDEADEDRG